MGDWIIDACLVAAGVVVTMVAFGWVFQLLRSYIKGK